MPKALADVTNAVKLDPGRSSFHTLRGIVLARTNSHADAVAEYDQAIERDPGIAEYYLLKGDFKSASVTLLRSIDLEDDVYAMLFRYLSRARAGETIARAELEANVARLKTKEWPYAAVELYLGRRTPELVLDAADKPGSQCEAQFYIGEWYILKGSVVAAASSLKAAVDTCPKIFIEYGSALAELNRLQPR